MARTARTSRSSPTDPVADPFGERRRPRYRRQYTLLGARFLFDSDSRAALRLADAAFSGLPMRRLTRGAPSLQVSLRVGRQATLGRVEVPPAPRFHAAGGLIVATVDGCNHAIVCPAQRTALVVMSPDMLGFPYHARYELIEFVVYTLATRALGLLALHAACISVRGRALLLMGDSGAGKSTLSLLAAMHGLPAHAEDVCFVDARRLRVHALPNFLHVHRDALRLLSPSRLRARLRRSPSITRRGGARKLEIDLRRLQQPPPGPLPLQALVFLRKDPARAGHLLRALPGAALRARLARQQPFARAQPGWPALLAGCSRVNAFELRRHAAPAQMLEALTALA